MADDEPSSDPEKGAEPPATGERADHHNAAPGVSIPGGAGTDPARPVEPGGEEPDEEVDEDAARERGDE